MDLPIMMNAHLLSFANRRYRGSLSRIRREAKVMKRFTSIHAVDERWLAPEYWQQHGETVRRHRRGFGLWTWKPYAIRRHLEQLPAGDMLVYCDAGCSLNAEGRPRLDEYFAIAAGHPTGVLAFTLDGRVGQWTKRATLVAFNADDSAMRAREMVAATALVFRVAPETLDLVREWETRMRNVSLIDDSPSPQGEHPEFRGHRHDQSIFTLLAYERALQRIPDETWFGDEWDGFRQFPIHARRWRHSLPWSQGWMRRGLWRV
jgi:hypothetical protein